MEKSEKHRFNHKSKEKVKIKPNNKGDSKKKKIIFLSNKI
jgi:hypothetical protein